jgi:hypothetical protein
MNIGWKWGLENYGKLKLPTLQPHRCWDTTALMEVGNSFWIASLHVGITLDNVGVGLELGNWC